MKLFALFFLFLLIFSSSVFALDFIAAGDTEISAFKCYTTEKQIYISNQEQQPLIVSLSVGGTAKELVKFSELNIPLLTGESKTITIFYDIPCNVLEGKYDLDIYFTSENSEKILSQKIDVLTPDNLFITIQPTEQEIKPCTTANYEIKINNPTKINEKYTLELDSFKDEYEIKTNFTINAFENKTTNLKITPKDCKKHGNFQVNLIAKTEKTGITKKIPLILNITQEGIPEIAEDINRIRTDFSKKEAEIIVKNLGEKDITYQVSITGPNWITIPNKLQINAKDQTTLNLLLQAKNTTKTGEYEIQIDLAIAETNTHYTKNLTVLLKPFSLIERKPYILYVPLLIILLVAIIIITFVFISRTKAYKEIRTITIKKRTAKTKISEQKNKTKDKKKLERIKKREEKKKLKLELRNAIKEKRREKREEKQKIREAIKEKRREKREEKHKIREAIKEKRRRKQLERIGVREKARSFLKQKITNKIKSEFKLIPKEDIATQKKLKKNPFLIIFAIISIFLIVFIKIYGVAIILVFIFMLFFCKVKSTNKFIKRWKFLEKESTQKLNTKWKTGLYDLNTTTQKNVEKAKITIQKVPLKIENLKCYSAFNITSNIENMLKISTLKFKIPKKWFDKNNIATEDFRILKRTKTDWQKHKLQLIKVDKNFYYFTAEKLSTGEFALTGKAEPKEKIKKNRKLFWIVAIAIFVLFLLQPAFSVKGIPSQVWTKDVQHTIKLNQYFQDPDLDLLKFSADKTEHITITFDKNTAILNPAPNWIGEEYTIFHAEDSLGETASSNPVKLVVKEKIFFEATTLTWISLMILTFLLFLIIITLFEKK